MALSSRKGQNANPMASSSLELAVTHLNASVGPVLTVKRFARALVSGSLKGFKGKETALLLYMFVELEPSLIAKCATEAGSDLRRANNLYKESLKAYLPRVPKWEKAVEHLL